ncbi:MAG: ubiquinol-cytochrome C chaperone family protein [Caulobacteraceae bacterium]
MALGALRFPGGRRVRRRTLHDAAAAQARAPALYARMAAPDTVEGRFELLVLHVLLLIDRLDAESAREASQNLFDVFVSDLDGALREMGVGDLAVPKRMKALAELFYGRARAYRGAFAALPDQGELRGVVGRTILAGRASDPALLVGYVVDVRASLAATPLPEILAGKPRWPEPDPGAARGVTP